MKHTYAIFLLLCMIVVFPSTAGADGAYDSYFEFASSYWGTPKNLLVAVARVESGMNPWALNINGRSYYLDSKEAALRLARKAVRERKSVDLGIMQINSYWLRRLNLSPDDIIDPKLNIILGGWIMAQEIHRFGLNWKAIGSYHTPLDRNLDKAKSYADKVLKVWEGI